MMSGRLGDDARAVVALAHAQARELGQDWIGCEHLLLALTSTQDETGEFLRARGATPQRIEAQFARMVPSTGATTLFATIDHDALAAIGIDLDVIRDRVLAAFGAPAPAPTVRQPRRAPWRRVRHRATSPYGHLQPTPRVRRCLELSLHEAQASDSSLVHTQHLATALTGMHDPTTARILTAIGMSAPHLHTQLLNHYRRD